MSNFSRQQALCGHCGMKVIRHNLIAHTKNVHPGEKPKEKAHNMKTLDLMMMPPSKKSKIDNATEHAESDATFQGQYLALYSGQKYIQIKWNNHRKNS